MARRTRRRFLVESASTTAFVALGLGCQRSSARRRPEDVREIEQVFQAMRSRDGAGVSLRRAVGHRGLPMLDPFLLLDEIHSDRPEDYQAGFPTHPHRGFETVSYLIDGRFEHSDSVGNAGIIGPGDCQWMTAGRGIVHSEMPRQEPGKDLWGLQLWINLPAKLKMTEPRYQEIGARSIPELELGDAHARLVAGKLAGRKGPIDGVATSPTLLDVTLPAGAVYRHSLPQGDTSFVYVLAGEVRFGQQGKAVAEGYTGVFNKGAHMVASAERGGRFLLFSAAPIGEPVARRGPFVMNTEDEIRQAFEDYRSGRLVSGS
ncbi:MAG: pirin family protein [Deltaproteobacteria bacterium]|nr:pirin family protein [Deltaproteobacteria bacterium]